MKFTREGSPTYLSFWPADLPVFVNVPFAPEAAVQTPEQFVLVDDWSLVSGNLVQSYGDSRLILPQLLLPARAAILRSR
jgi:hypothetical protein